MVKRILILVFWSLLVSPVLRAQIDAYSGTWQMQYLSAPGRVPVSMELQISYSERNILYPAHLTLRCDSFIAEYELLLVKKNSRELGISKNKFARAESPFSIVTETIFLNGSFDYSKDLKGIPTLTALRIPSKQNGLPIADTAHLTPSRRAMAMELISFLQSGDISLKKINNKPWDDVKRDSILIPQFSPAYFGLLDTVFLPTRDGIANLMSNKKKEKDIVSVTLNGQVMLDKIRLNKQTHTEEILLDTGLNILTFFADNFGNALPNTGKLKLEFGHKKLSLEFTNKADSAATFIAVKLFCDPDKSKEIYFQNYTSGEEIKLKQNEKLIGNIISTSRDVIFALWDDNVEDGDSISINIDGYFLVRGFPVKNNPQFITVTLKPGANIISFIADNIGSIPPNTSVLEIIDGKKRKSFPMESGTGDKKLIKIFYDSGKSLQ